MPEPFPEYRTIRKGRIIQGHLYVGVGTPPLDFPDLGAGRVLRYEGGLQNPFGFRQRSVICPIIGFWRYRLMAGSSGIWPSTLAMTVSAGWPSRPKAYGSARPFPTCRIQIIGYQTSTYQLGISMVAGPIRTRLYRRAELRAGRYRISQRLALFHDHAHPRQYSGYA